MPAWSDREWWDRLVSGEGCPICLEGKPRGIVAELEGCYLTADEGAVALAHACAGSVASWRPVMD